jgi:hypothetical protein
MVSIRVVKMDVLEIFLALDCLLFLDVSIHHLNVHVYLHPLCGLKCTYFGHNVLDIKLQLSRTL